jgi:hypothetical protein
MAGAPADKGLRTVIGGRHGSPSVTIAMPFSKIESTDTDLRAAVAELATIVSQLATTHDASGRDALGVRAAEIAQQLDAG